MSKFLSWLPTILSAITWLIGQIQAAQAQVDFASGDFSSTEAATDAIAFWSNIESGGFVATVVTLAIPWLTSWYGKWKVGKSAEGWDYALDLGALNTLKNVTRVGIESDQAAIATLIESGIKRETASRLKAKPVVALEVK